jgi:hypothetical protein
MEPVDDYVLDHLFETENQIDVAYLCGLIGPGALSTHLEQLFDPHYLFKKSDQEELF